jgi:hypothetical protein
LGIHIKKDQTSLEFRKKKKKRFETIWKFGFSEILGNISPFDFAMYLCRAHHASCGAILDPRAMDL